MTTPTNKPKSAQPFAFNPLEGLATASRQRWAEFMAAPVANRTEPAPASKVRWYKVHLSRSPGLWSVYHATSDGWANTVATGMTRSLARKVCAMLNAASSTPTSKRKGSK